MLFYDHHVVDRDNSGLLVIVGNNASATVRKQSPNSRVTNNRSASVAVDILEIFRSSVIVWSKAPCPVYLTFIQHHVECLALVQPVQGNTRRRIFIQTQQNTMANFFAIESLWSRSCSFQ